LFRGSVVLSHMNKAKAQTIRVIFVTHDSPAKGLIRRVGLGLDS
jgi:hypothetical protein